MTYDPREIAGPSSPRPAVTCVRCGGALSPSAGQYGLATAGQCPGTRHIISLANRLGAASRANYDRGFEGNVRFINSLRAMLTELGTASAPQRHAILPAMTKKARDIEAAFARGAEIAHGPGTAELIAASLEVVGLAETVADLATTASGKSVEVRRWPHRAPMSLDHPYVQRRLAKPVKEKT